MVSTQVIDINIALVRKTMKNAFKRYVTCVFRWGGLKSVYGGAKFFREKFSNPPKKNPGYVLVCQSIHKVKSMVNIVW